LTVKVCASVITLDEEPRIGDCLKHLRPHVDHIVVVDSGSSDRTVEIAEKYADRVEVKPEFKRQDERYNHAMSLVPKDCGWILWVDADERFDLGFLRSIRRITKEAEMQGAGCFRFPRINLPDSKDFPDYQVRLFRNSRDITIRGHLYPIVFLELLGMPLDQADRDEMEEKLYVFTVDAYPMIHLPRREDIRREWWE